MNRTAFSNGLRPAYMTDQFLSSPVRDDLICFSSQCEEGNKQRTVGLYLPHLTLFCHFPYHYFYFYHSSYWDWKEYNDKGIYS